MPQKSRTAAITQFAIIAAAAAAVIYLMAPGAPATGKVRAIADRKAPPDFSLPAVSGGHWRLSDHRGKVVLVNFWATWCPPCRREIPELVELARTYGDGRVEVVGITMDEDPSAVVPDFVARFRIPYPILVPTSGFGLAAAIQSLPTTLLLDREGRLAKAYYGAVTGRAIAADIDVLLAERGREAGLGRGGVAALATGLDGSGER